MTLSGPGEGYNVDWSVSEESQGSEEPWEQQIASLLGSLPPVEPPPGFLESLAANGPTIQAPFTLDADEMFTFPFIAKDSDE